MPMNNLTSDQMLWWAQQPHIMEPPPDQQKLLLSPLHHHHLRHPFTAAHPPTYNFNLNHQLQDHAEQLECDETSKGEHRQHMFEKPLTPSDVGKLNRLVIPKQHAEKYFPMGAALAGGGSNGGDSVEKGLLLSFEDESGKQWRFRYSYWNSSQSYVLTKGWSRFVKEKKLDAGDVVLFERDRSDVERMFIGWRRRVQEGAAVHGGEMVAGNGMGWGRVLYDAHPYHSSQVSQGSHGPLFPYQQPHAVMNEGSKSSRAGGNTTKRLRLFGVNLECCQPDDHDDDESAQPSTPDDSSTSTTHGPPHDYHYNLFPPISLHTHSLMDMNVNQTRYHHQQQQG